MDCEGEVRPCVKCFVAAGADGLRIPIAPSAEDQLNIEAVYRTRNKDLDLLFRLTHAIMQGRLIDSTPKRKPTSM